MELLSLFSLFIVSSYRPKDSKQINKMVNHFIIDRVPLLNKPNLTAHDLCLAFDGTLFDPVYKSNSSVGDDRMTRATACCNPLSLIGTFILRTDS